LSLSIISVQGLAKYVTEPGRRGQCWRVVQMDGAPRAVDNTWNKIARNDFSVIIAIG
jgi:hypothetical protein